MNVLRPICLALLSSLLILSSDTAYSAQPLGRLFLSTEERANLDRQQSPPPPEPATITFDGIVRRTSGSTTIWLNRQPQYRPPRNNAANGESQPLIVHTEILSSRIAASLPTDRRTARADPECSIEMTIAGAKPQRLQVGDSLDLNRWQQRPPLGSGRLLIAVPANRVSRTGP